jgi:branched-chain amino acid transport system permease protein
VITGGLVAACVLAILLPYVVSTVYVILAINVLVATLLAMSFNLLYGYAGMFSFGQAGFYGLGAYATALLLSHTSLGFVPALLLSACIAGVAGLVLGALLVGLDRIAFIMLTFAAAELLQYGAQQLVGLTNGDSGLIVNVPPSLNLVANTRGVYFTMLVISTVVIGLLFALVKSPFGLTLRALKENPKRVETIGVDVRRQKLIVFVLAAMVAGVAGSLAAVANQVLYPDTFGWLTSADALIATLLGGAAYFFGPLVGSIAFGLIGLYAGRATTNLSAVNGFVFLAIIVLAPQGLTALAARILKLRRPRRGSSAAQPHRSEPLSLDLSSVDD